MQENLMHDMQEEQEMHYRNMQIESVLSEEADEGTDDNNKE